MNHPSENIRVCHLLGDLGSGGRESLLLDLIEHTVGVDHHIACFNANHQMSRQFKDSGVSVTNFDAASRVDPLAFKRLYDLLRRERFDVLHGHGVNGQVPARLFATRTPVGAVVSTHHIVQSANSLPGALIERATRSLDDVTIAVSHGVLDSFSGTSDQWRVVHNGIDVEAFHDGVTNASPTSLREEYDIAETDTVFLSVGRYTTDKAQGDLVRAMDHVVERTRDGHLLLVGGRGGRDDSLRALARRLELTEYVTITGRVPSIVEYYALADVFVSSSIREGLPLVLLEAMAAELPVIATDIPGVTEVIVDGETGILVPPETSERLGEEMLAMTAPERRAQFGTAGYKHVREAFDIAQTADAYEGIYQEVVS